MRNGGLGFPALLLQKSFASVALLRRYSNKVPCSSLVPDLVETFKTPPENRPHSAERLLLSTLNSCAASTVGIAVMELNNPAVVGIPSTYISVLCFWPPLME